VSEEPNAPLVFVAAAGTGQPHDGAFVAIVRTREDFLGWLNEPAAGPEWLQVEGLLGDVEVWAAAAHGPSETPLDVMLADPACEFSSLYRLVAVGAVRDVRVTIPAAPGFMKALRLAASLGFPVRLLPGQPSADTLVALSEAADFYLHDPVVEAPIEFFHSLLAALRGAEATTLWKILEHDPAIFALPDSDAHARLPRNFVATHLRGLIESGAECASCRWQNVCAGYFKWPDPAYSCTSVQRLFAHLEAAAAEIGSDLAELEPAATQGATP
jgi:hypothetical protein